MTESLARLAVALVLALPVGWNRTFPLVAVAACAFVLVGDASVGTSPGERADVLYGILMGVGFIGSGALIQNQDAARGMATVVSLWVTVAIGVAAAYGLYVVAVAMSLLSFVALHLPSPRASRGR